MVKSKSLIKKTKTVGKLTSGMCSTTIFVIADMVENLVRGSFMPSLDKTSSVYNELRLSN